MQCMPRPVDVLLCSFLAAGSLTMVRAQEVPAPTNQTKEMKTLVVASEAKSDSVVAVPPVRSVGFNVKGEKRGASAEIADLASWLSREAALNGLQSTDLRPWHILVTYDQFDEDGDNVHSGTYEEYWVGPKKYRRIYKSDNLNQTDYATDKGLYRRGDQQWPDRAQLEVREEIIAPFSYAATQQGLHGRNVESIFSGYKLQCVVTESNAGLVHPPQYCFEPDSSVLRYNSGFGWFQIVHNRIVRFQERNLAQEVEVTDAGKPYLKLSVNTIELISHVDDADYLPPSDAVGPLGDRVSGVHLMPIPNKMSFPQWPTSLRGQHFAVTVEIVIGKDGHVVSVRGVSGPTEGYKACEDAVRNWVFKPYLVLDKPVEVEEKVACNNN